MKRLSLESLIAPHSRELFFRDYWPDRLLVVHGDVERLAPLRGLPELQSARALAAVHHESVLTYLSPRASREQRREGGRVRAAEAVELYEQGARLEFNHIDRWIPALSDQMRRLARDLGMPPDRVTCSFFAMPPGQVVAPHFDTQPALCIQLQGTKTWRIGPRPTVPAPLHNHVLGEVSCVIGDYHPEPLPPRMPDDSIEVVMQPGSVVYLPRGLPHETVSHDHTLSVTLDINHSTWTDLVVEGIRRRLARDPAWREHAIGVDGGPDDRAAALRRLEALLPGVHGALDDLVNKPRELLELGATALVPGARQRYSKRPGVEVHMERVTEATPSEQWQMVVAHPVEGRTEILVSEELVPACRWIAARRTSFLDSDAYAESRSAGRGDLVNLISVLLEADALEAVPA